jgi:hypothetical protein
MTRAALASNRGDASIVVTSAGSSAHDGEDGVDASLRLEARHWDGEHDHPSLTEVEGLWLRSAEVAELCACIERWAALPLDEMRDLELTGGFELAGMAGQSVRIRFGRRTDLISSRHPVVTISWKVGALAGELFFATDPSCLGPFAADLRRLTGA